MQQPAIQCNIEAEIALIGCDFVDENILLEVSDLLLPEDFYDVKNRLIYKTMLKLIKEGKNVDVMTVLSALQGDHLLEQCGG